MRKEIISRKLAEISRWMNNPVLSASLCQARREQLTQEYFDLKSNFKEAA